MRNPDCRIEALPTPDRMPTTSEALRKAEAEIAPLLREGFFGRVTLIYEHGRMVRVELLESVKV